MHIQSLFLSVAVVSLSSAADLRWSRSVDSVDSSLRGPVIARDSSGNLYVASATRTVNLPVAAGAYQPALLANNCFLRGDRCRDLYISKYDGEGRVIWSSYLGTADDDLAVGIAVDAARDVYVAAASYNQQPCTGPCNEYGWVTKLSPTGEHVLGRFCFDGVQLSSMALSDTGDVYVGGTTSTDPQGDIFVGKLGSALDGFGYMAHVPGGSRGSVVRDLAITRTGEAVVVGQTASDDFPATANGYQRHSGGEADGFVIMLDVTGAIGWATYLGGEGNDSVECVATGPGGQAYVASTAFAGTRLNVLDPNGTRIQPLATPQLDVLPETLTTDRDGNLVLGGRATSGKWPVTQDALEPVLYGPAGVIAVIDSSTAQILYASYIGRTDTTSVTDIVTGDAGQLYVTGQAFGTDWLTMPLNPPNGGGGFTAHIDVEATPSQPRIRAVVNSASFTGGPLVRGELISIFGEEIGPNTPIIAEPLEGEYPRRLGRLQVLANGTPLPLLYASRTQVNAAVPMLTDQPVVQIVVDGERGTTAPFSLAQRAAAVGVFTRDGSGQGQAAALNQDDSPNSPANPARKGSIVQLWVTGVGLTNPPQPDGRVTPSDDRSSTGLPVITLRSDSMITQVLAAYSGAAPGLIAGVAQINFRIPNDAPTGPDVNLAIQYGLGQAVTIAIAE